MFSWKAQFFTQTSWVRAVVGIGETPRDGDFSQLSDAALSLDFGRNPYSHLLGLGVQILVLPPFSCAC